MTRLPMTLLGVVLLMTLNGLKVQAQVAEQDSLALVTLYNATDGPNWTDDTNWLAGPVSQWHGVTVDGNRVRELRFGSNQLTGSLPPELGNLTSLVYLNLFGNELTGEIPSDLGNLTNLTRLYFGGNQFTGEIPMELGNLANLTILSLFGNGLTGEIPVELGNLTNLTILSFSSNLLTGAIPPELGNLAKLNNLNFVGNLLTGAIPPELGNLAKLTALSFRSNQLTGAVPPELGSLANLTFLDLSNNPLSGTLPQNLTNLSMLGTFWFHNTDLCEPLNDAFQAWIQGISSVERSGCTNVATEETAEIPSEFALNQNYPNPFNPATTIRYALPQRAPVRLSVYDVQGRLVAVLVEAEQATGWHEVRFEAGALPSGVYFYRLEAGAFQTVRQMLLLR